MVASNREGSAGYRGCDMLTNTTDGATPRARGCVDLAERTGSWRRFRSVRRRRKMPALARAKSRAISTSDRQQHRRSLQSLSTWTENLFVWRKSSHYLVDSPARSLQRKSS